MTPTQASSGPARLTRWGRFRIALLGALFLGLLGAGLARAIELQVFERDRLRELAEEQYRRKIEIPARRGDVFDRRGVPLAQSVEVDSLWIDPSLVPDLRSASKELAKKLRLDGAELYRRLSRARRFAWVKRQAKPDEVRVALGTRIPSLAVIKEPRRFYPQRDLAAHVLGMTGTDGTGLEGLELAFNDELTGRNSMLSGFRDAKGRKLLMQETGEPSDRQGASVHLTLDRHIQYLAEKALTKAVEDAKAVAGMAVVLNPKTGELLAVANFPSFNPNTPAAATPGAFRNRAAMDSFEPGSTFKAFTLAAGLEAGMIKPDDVFDCEQGAYDIGRNTIHDTHPHGWLTPAKILQLSSNIGAAKVAQRVGRETVVDYYARFGFGRAIGLGLPGEAKGSVPYPKAELALATAAFGQGLSVTAIQLAAGYGAIANGGVLMRPFLLQKVVDADGLVLVENRPTAVRQAISARTAQQLISMLEGVVEKEGTAPRAKMEEFRVAGKTGTAQKADPIARGYSDKRIASFIGMVPAEAPRAVILVVIDEPKTDVFGGVAAAPAFKEIATGAMPYLGVSPSRRDSLVQTVATSAGPPQAPAPSSRAPPDPPVAAEITGHVGRGKVAVPDVGGRSGREAIASLLAVALEPRLSGMGRVVSQQPASGSLVDKGSRVKVELATRQ